MFLRFDGLPPRDNQNICHPPATFLIGCKTSFKPYAKTDWLSHSILKSYTTLYMIALGCNYTYIQQHKSQNLANVQYQYQ